jgi:hypothetical protein
MINNSVQNEFSATGAFSRVSTISHRAQQGAAAMKTLALIAATAVIATTTAAGAHDYGRDARIDARQAEQAYRIQHNRRTGNLTLLEKWRLKAQQARIASMERAAERDGYISRSEARRIGAAQDRASHDIYRQSHDGQKAWWRRVW